MRVNVSLNDPSSAPQLYAQAGQQQQQYYQDPAVSHHYQQEPYYNQAPSAQYPEYGNNNNTSSNSACGAILQPAVQHLVPMPQGMSTPPQHQAMPNNYSAPNPFASASTNSSDHSFYGAGSASNASDEVMSQESVFASTANTVASAPSCDGSNVRPMGTDRQHRGKVDPSRFKTEPCTYYVRGEACPYTPYCAFAHGPNERRSRRRNVKEGVTKVNTLPRTMVYHEVWVQTTKYTRKTGPASNSANTTAPPPAPSFLKKSAPTA